MEEAELLKQRLQAITDKRKIQEDIAHKRLEIDKEKLKLQHHKKKALRDQWLMDGVNTHNTQGRDTMTQQAQLDAQQTRLLQSNIHRIEKNIEALEREELNISTNEGLILKRLRAIEKSPEDIIKAAKAEFNPEPLRVYTAIPDMPKSYKSLNLRRRQGLEQGSDKDQPKPALFAMEISVQKDLRTGESHVVSTATVSPAELQQRGVKVYDDGRKSVYALRADGDQAGGSGVDELTPAEVDELLRQATESKQRRQQGSAGQPHAPAQGSAGRPHAPAQGSAAYAWPPDPRKPQRDRERAGHGANGFQEPGGRGEVAAWPELTYGEGARYPEDEALGSRRVPLHSYGHGQGEGYYQPSNGHRFPSAAPGREASPWGAHPGHSPFYDPREEGLRAAQLADSYAAPPKDSRLSVLNAMPADEPVTMIFMGYQDAEDDGSQGYEGSIRAELVIIGDGDDGVKESFGSYQRQDGYHSFGFHQNCNANNAGPYAPYGPQGAYLEPEVARARYQGPPLEGAGAEKSSATGIRKIKKLKRRRNPCCSLM